MGENAWPLMGMAMRISSRAAVIGPAPASGKFVAVDAFGAVAYSSDGVTWTTTTVGSGMWYGVCYGG